MTRQEQVLSDWYVPQIILFSACQQLWTKQNLIRNSWRSFSFDLSNNPSWSKNAISLLSCRFSVLSSASLILFPCFIYVFKRDLVAARSRSVGRSLVIFGIPPPKAAALCALGQQRSEKGFFQSSPVGNPTLQKLAVKKWYFKTAY